MKKRQDIVDTITEKIAAMDKIGVIAGGGLLPRHVYDACKERGIGCHIIGIDGQITEELFEGVDYEKLPVHSLSKIIKSLRDANVKYIIPAGKVHRTNLSKLLLDIKGAKLLTMIMRNGISDNTLLSTIISFFEKEGFEILPPEQIVSDIILKSGNLTTNVKITQEAFDDIEKGIKILKSVAEFDIGQALVIQNGLVLGIEAAEGTDELIKRCGEIKQINELPPILIKICKPNQDKRIDLPCIGPNTIENLMKHGFAGVASESGLSLILDQKHAIDLANKNNVFIYGI